MSTAWLLLLWPAIGIPAFYRSLPPSLRPRAGNEWIIFLIFGAAVGPIALTSPRIWRR